MVVLIDEILKDVFLKIGNQSSDEGSILKFMFSGQQPLKIAMNFFKSAKTAVLTDKYIELVTDKDEAVKFQLDILSIGTIVKLLQQNIKKLECKKFNEKFLPFWDAMKSNVKELELSDFNFDNEQYTEAVKNMDSLEKATIELDVYCLNFLDGITLTCNELYLKGEAYDQIENGECDKIKFPHVKKLTVKGHYVGWGTTDMTLEGLIKNLKDMCPDIEELTLIIDDDIGGDEEPKTYIDLISKPNVDSKLDLKVIFNLTMVETTWQKSDFLALLKKDQNVEAVGPKDTDHYNVKLTENKLIEIHLSSEMAEEDADSEESSLAEPPAKRMKA